MDEARRSRRRHRGSSGQTLEHVRGERTILVVARRRSSVKTCDYIVFGEEGHILTITPNGESIETNRTFREMRLS
jgi:ABC-type multidrug transport system fused ATPase/permease subunit